MFYVIQQHDYGNQNDHAVDKSACNGVHYFSVTLSVFRKTGYRVTLIGCPKLDEGDYAEKLTAILRENDIQSVTVARMEVPCCGGIENAVKRALQQSGKFIPWRVAVISTDGRTLSD